MERWDSLSEIEIKEKYLKPPTLSQIFGFIQDLGVATRQFERYYSIPPSVLRQVKGGYRNLPTKFWPIFYERIVPQYGITYTKKYQKNLLVTNKVTNHLPDNAVTSDSHDRTGNLK